MHSPVRGRARPSPFRVDERILATLAVAVLVAFDVGMTGLDRHLAALVAPRDPTLST